MSEYQPETYGEQIADVYDDWYKAPEAAMIDRLASLAGAGPALELGIGTGRVALPLSERGVLVSGIDASPKMVEKLRAKPGGEEIAVAFGDFTEVEIEGEFSLVYVAFNTFFALLTQEAQLRCFCQVARKLSAGGSFAMDVFIPDLARFTHNQSTVASQVGVDKVVLDVTRHDPVAQKIIGQHVHIGGAGIRLYPVQLRYAWPSELDLMAKIAGLELAHRWSDWGGSSFVAASGKHISIYRKV
jgi:SAM-dependent methyltransferase